MLWHWIWSGLDQGKDLTRRCKGNLFPERGLGRAVAAIVGVYSSSTFAGAQISDGSCSTIAHTLIYAKSPYEPAYLVVYTHKRQGEWRLGAVIS